MEMRFPAKGMVMRTLITGGAGFLGSHLCDYLLAKGHRVICVDNLDTGSLQNIEHVNNGEDFLFVNHVLPGAAVGEANTLNARPSRAATKSRVSST